MIEEASAHEEEEKAPLLRGGSPQITDWTYTKSGTTITLTGYTGSSTDVVIPTAQDFGFDESYTAKISKKVLQSVATNKTSVSTSSNGNKIVMSSPDLNSCFRQINTLKEVDLTNLDVSGVSQFGYGPWTEGLFVNCENLVTVKISNWNVKNVRSMACAFYACISLKNLDVSNWNTSNVTNMSGVFSGCSSLTSLDVSKWNTSNVTDMSSMFSGCSSLTNLNVSKWNTSNVTYMSG
ncbi:TPA: BspA family leucine-rich repeat surface protein, partial [Enterococcus faecium]